MMLTCHGEDSHRHADPSVAQQGDLCPVCLHALLQPPGLHGGPDAGAQHQQVEEHHHYQSWDVQAHRAMTDWLTLSASLKPNYYVLKPVETSKTGFQLVCTIKALSKAEQNKNKPFRCSIYEEQIDIYTAKLLFNQFQYRLINV